MSSILIQELLNNNLVPPEGLVNEIEEMRCESLRDLGDLDTKILEVVKHLNVIQTMRAAVQAKISQYDLILSPIRRVPACIFYQIFHYCLPTLRNPIPRGNESPLSLTHVCHTWRSTALSSPRLWTRLHITFTEDQATLEESILQGRDYYNGSSKERVTQILRTRYDAIKEWLSRSQTCPLSISINFSLKRGSTTSLRDEGSLSKITLELFALMKSVSNRLENLEFTGPPEIYRILESMFPITETKMLTSLKIRPIHDGPSSTLDPRPIKSLDAPNLTRIGLAGDVFRFWDVPTSSLQWKNFTDISLHYGGLSITYIDMFLKKCSNLVHFLVVVAPSPAIRHREPIHLPFLIALCIEERVLPELMRNIYERIDAPQLKWVNYASHPLLPMRGRQNILDRTIPIIQLLQNCRELKKLTFDGSCYSPSVMHSLYQSVRGITDLSIGTETRPAGGGYDRSRDRLRRLRGTRAQEDTWNIGALITNGMANDLEGDSILLPHLETLDVFSDEGGIPDRVLQQFIESRMVSPSPQKIAALKKLNLPHAYVVNLDTWPSVLHRAKVAGIDIKVDLGYLPWTFSRILSFERQMDGYGRTWCELDVREHAQFVN